MVVVTPTGVWIIEDKNITGSVFGNYDSPMWTQRKEGRQGGSYTKTFCNPNKQVGMHTYRLAHLLRDNGFSVYVKDMVYFANSETVIRFWKHRQRRRFFLRLQIRRKSFCGQLQTPASLSQLPNAKPSVLFGDGCTA